MEKKKIIRIIVILVLIIFFFPKGCGGSGGIGLSVTTIDCKCIGIKGDPLFILFGGRIMDASPRSCYGICLKNTCETTTSPLIIDGCAGVHPQYHQECCERWAQENDIVKIACVGNWTLQEGGCGWVCS